MAPLLAEKNGHDRIRPSASWYAATRDADESRAPLAQEQEADIAVVGGGFAGLHTARLLAQAGKRVVLLERRRIGWGASGRNGGFVGPGYAQRSGALIDRLGLEHARQLYVQSQRGVAIVRNAISELERPDILMGSGKLSVSRTDQGTGFADRTRRLAEQLGASFEPWATSRVRGVLATARYHQAIHDPDLVPYPSAESRHGSGQRHRTAGQRDS